MRIIMNSTIHFDICAIIILTILLLALFMRKLNKGRSNMMFCVMVIIVLAEGIFSYFGAHLDNMDIEYSLGRGIRYVVDYIHMFCIVYEMPLFLLYILSLLGVFYKIEKEILLRLMWWVPIGIEALLLVINMFTGIMFYYDENMVFQRTGLLSILYYVSFYYIFFGLYLLISHRKLLTKTKFYILCIFAPVNIGILVTQLLVPDLRLNNIALAIFFVIIAVAIQKPEEYLDIVTDTQSYSAFLNELNKVYMSGTSSRLIIFKFVNHRSLRNTMGLEMYTKLVRQIAGMIKTMNLLVKSRCEIFYLDDGTFVALGSYRYEENVMNLGRMISAYTQEPIRINKMEVMLEPCVCFMSFPEDISNIETLSRFINEIENRVPNDRHLINLGKHSKLKDFRMINDIDEIINRGIINNRFEMYYQPIYSIKDKKFLSAEALIRLIDEEYGFVSPGIFIPAAEKSGAIHQIGDFVFNSVCEFMASDEYKALDLNCIEINLSVAQCIELDIVEKFTEVTERLGVDPSSINLEITETAMDYDPFITDSNIGRLRKRGYTFSLDDYGTGYSNIRRLVSLPIDIVKIDRSLVVEMDNPQMWTVITNTVRMLKNMKKKILVEGIEDARAVDRFVELGCDYIQGFYYSKPLSKRAFIEFIKKENGL